MQYYCSVLCIALLTGLIATLGSAEPAGCHWEKTDKGDRCYVLIDRADMPAKVDFFEAAAQCAQHHKGTLPVLDSPDVATKLGAYMDRLQAHMHMDGRPAQGKPVDEKASWHYSDGTPVPHGLWAAGEPKDQPNAGLVCMWWINVGGADRELNTVPCDTESGVADLLCEWRRAATTTTTRATTTTRTATETRTSPTVRTTTTRSSTRTTRVPLPPVPPPSPRPQPTPAPVDTWTTAWNESDNSTSSAGDGHHRGYDILPLLLAAVAAAGAFCLF